MEVDLNYNRRLVLIYGEDWLTRLTQFEWLTNEPSYIYIYMNININNVLSHMITKRSINVNICNHIGLKIYIQLSYMN